MLKAVKLHGVVGFHELLVLVDLVKLLQRGHQIHLLFKLLAQVLGVVHLVMHICFDSLDTRHALVKDFLEGSALDLLLLRALCFQSCLNAFDLIIELLI